MNLSPRQSQILKAIIEEYIENAMPVASVELVERRRIPLSGATVRNVMSDLVKLGYLGMDHVSSGRRPTEIAYKYYISQLMDEPEISIVEEVSIKQRVWSNRYELEKLLRSATQALSETTGVLAISVTDEGFIYHCGGSRILEDEEFLELSVTKALFRLLDDYTLMKSIFERVQNGQGVSILIGREIGIDELKPVSLIFVSKQIQSKKCYLGVIGPDRIRYDKVIAVIRYMADLLDEVNQSI